MPKSKLKANPAHGFYALAEGVLSLGFLVGAPVAAALGQLLLALILLALAVGIFLRLKRRTAWRTRP